MKNHSKELSTIKTLFQNKSYFARFVHDNVFDEFLQNVEASSALKDLINTVEIYSDTALSQLTARAKRDVKQAASRDPYVINQLLHLDHEPLLDKHQFDALHSLLDSELDNDVFDDNELPNIMLATPSRYSDKMRITLLICRDCDSERNFDYGKISKLHEKLPDLVSLKLHSVTIADFPAVTKCTANHLRFLDIKFYSMPRQLSNLLLFITKSYSSHLKELTLEQLGPNISSNLLNLKKTDVGAARLLKDGCKFKFPKLRTLQINNLYQYPKLVAKFVECILKEECKLKKVSLNGLYNKELIKSLQNTCNKTLVNLSVNINDRESLNYIAKMKNLKRLRVCLLDSTVNVTIFDVLESLPHLKQLEFAFDLEHGRILHTIDDRPRRFENLIQLSLDNVSYDEEEIKKLEMAAENVEEILYNNCVIVKRGKEKNVNLTFKGDSLPSNGGTKRDNGTDSKVTEELVVGSTEDAGNYTEDETKVGSDADNEEQSDEENTNEDNIQDTEDVWEEPMEIVEEVVEKETVIVHSDTNEEDSLDEEIEEVHEELSVQVTVSNEYKNDTESDDDGSSESAQNDNDSEDAQNDDISENAQQDDASEGAQNDDISEGTQNDDDGSSEDAQNDNASEGSQNEDNESTASSDDNESIASNDDNVEPQEKDTETKKKRSESDSEYEDDTPSESESTTDSDSENSDFENTEGLRRSTRNKRGAESPEPPRKKRRVARGISYKLIKPESDEGTDQEEQSESESKYEYGSDENGSDTEEEESSSESEQDEVKGFINNVKFLKPVIRIKLE